LSFARMSATYFADLFPYVPPIQRRMLRRLQKLEAATETT